jgi:hypothetical protein
MYIRITLHVNYHSFVSKLVKNIIIKGLPTPPPPHVWRLTLVVQTHLYKICISPTQESSMLKFASLGQAVHDDDRFTWISPFLPIWATLMKKSNIYTYDLHSYPAWLDFSGGMFIKTFHEFSPHMSSHGFCL